MISLSNFTPVKFVKESFTPKDVYKREFCAYLTLSQMVLW